MEWIIRFKEKEFNQNAKDRKMSREEYKGVCKGILATLLSIANTEYEAKQIKVEIV